MGSAVPSRVSLLISILRLNIVLTYMIPPDAVAASIHLLITAIRHVRSVPSLSGHAIVVSYLLAIIFISHRIY